MIAAPPAPPARNTIRPSAARNEESLPSLARAALAESGYPPLARIECEAVQGTLVLSGVVSSFYLKQIAQTVVMQLEAAHGVENRVEVQSQ